MAEQFYTILTNIGKAKIANAAALNSKLNIITCAVGDGNGAYYEPTETQTALKNEVWRKSISSITIDDDNPNWILVETIIPATDGGFTIREAAIFDDANNMIAVGKFPETYKPVASDGSTKDLDIKMILEVSNASSVTLTLDPTVILATKKDIQNLSNSITAINNNITAQLSDMAQDRIYYCGTTSGTNTYTAANSKITAYIEGLTVRVKIGTASTGASTININSLGAIPILDSLGNPITNGGLKAGLPYQLCYNGVNFIVLGKGGGGNATADKVLSPYTVTTDVGQITGTMTNYTSDQNCSGYGTSGTTIGLKVPKGYWDGTHNVNVGSTSLDSNLTAANIANGKSILGVAGNYNPLKLVSGTSIVLYDAIVNYECNSISSYVLAKSVTNGNIGGTVTVSFSLADGSTGNGGAYGRIYVNGVAVGTERYIAAGTGTTWFTEDITINTGDSIQIYARKGSNPAAGDIYVVELKISCGNSYGHFA